jgi:hypothetical protein
MMKEPNTKHFAWNAAQRRWLYSTALAKGQPVNQEGVVKDAHIQVKVLNQMDKENTSKKLVEILDLMPTLQIKLSEVQKKVVASNQNLLCLGRSGTGKTTTSVLRLFAQEILYSILKKTQDKGAFKPTKPHEEEGKEPPAKRKQLIKAKDLDRNTGMKMVFITASPVLTNEVRRFYSGIKGKLLHLLRQRD